MCQCQNTDIDCQQDCLQFCLVYARSYNMVQWWLVQRYVDHLAFNTEVMTELSDIWGQPPPRGHADIPLAQQVSLCPD